MAQHDPQHTSYASNPGPQNNDTLWTFSMMQPFRFSPVINSSGEVYAVSGNWIFAINANGSVKWFASVSDPAASPAIGPDGSIYVPARKFVAAFSPTGTLEWNLTTPDFNEGADLTVAPSGQIYSVNNGVLYSITPAGEISWTLDTGCVTSAVAIGQGGMLYCGARKGSAGMINAIDPHGAIVWTVTTGGNSPLLVTPTVGANGTIYVPSAGGTFFALNPIGTIEWEVVNMTTMDAPAAVGPNGTVYIGGPYLYALTPNGTVIWSQTCFPVGTICEPFGTVTGLTVDSNGTLYVTAVLGQASRLLVFDSFGNFLYSLSPPGSQVFPDGGAIGRNGLLYLGTYCDSCELGLGSGRLYAIGAQGPNSSVVFQSDLPLGQPWSVSVDGQTYVTTNQTMTIAETSGVHAWQANATLAVSPGVRYELVGSNSGTINLNGVASVYLNYTLQDLVRFMVAPVGGGTTSLSLNWLGALSNDSITATPAAGYVFTRWMSNTTLLALTNATLPTTHLFVSGTGGVTAIFSPIPPPQAANFTIVASAGGAVSYSYSGIQGVVPSGGSDTITVPVGAGVVLTATPRTGYLLSGWDSVPATTGYGNLTTVVFRVLESSQLEASFSLQPVTSTTTTSTTTTSTSTSSLSTSTQTTKTSTTTTSSSGITTKLGVLGSGVTVSEVGLILVGAGVILALVFLIVRWKPRKKPTE